MSNQVSDLIDMLHAAHRDNSKMGYWGRLQRRKEKSIMPVTPFVFEFFLYNSLYQVDWSTSLETGELCYQSSKYLETKQQSEFEKFLRKKCAAKPDIICRAFSPLLEAPLIEGEWMRITPDARITEECGKDFLKKIEKLRGEIAKLQQGKASIPSIFDIIAGCRYFIYMVRNNIFHGSKTLGETYEPHQRLRIELYDLFLKCLTSLFFLIVKKEPVASDTIQFSVPLYFQSKLDSCTPILAQSIIVDAINKGIMRIEDSRLIAHFVKNMKPQSFPPDEASALFYPSAGEDLLAPILLGLPFCRNYYLYEKSPSNKLPAIKYFLNQIEGIQCIDQNWASIGTEHTISFQMDGLARQIHWVHEDNKSFLDKDVLLTFYFHRGDSWGKGGSGQKWNSELLTGLAKKATNGHSCVFLTDGDPGSLHPVLMEQVHRLKFFSETTYYCGFLPNHIAAKG